jgi:ferredoxin, 2Fe-2S
MPKIIFITAGGVERVVEAPSGHSVMDAAVNNLVAGIDGDCGGVAACGTCHVYVDPAWMSKTGAITPGIEQEMLALTDNVQETSRLSCQIQVSDALDGLVLRMPEAQH